MQTARTLGSLALATLIVTMLPATGAAASPVPSPEGVPRLAGLRTVTVPGARIISMSPDGRSIAAVRPAVGYQRGHLCVVDLETLVDRACADLGGLDVGIRLEDVTWSPDSSRLAFTGNAFQTLVDGDLWVMDAATGDLTNVDDDGFEGKLPVFNPDADGPPVAVPANPAFSPDSTTIAFSRSVFDGDRRDDWIATVPASGGEVTPLRRIVDLPGIVYFGMAWAPEGDTIYFSFQAPRRGDIRNGVWAMPADGGTPSQIVAAYQDTQGPAILDVSPDGAWLLLQDPAALGSYAGQLPVYAVASADGAEVTPLVPLDPDAPPASFVGWAGFSPDSRWLLTVERRTGGSAFEIHVRDIAGTIDVPLATDGVDQAGPVDRGVEMTWSPGGTAFVTAGGTLDTGYLLTIDGGTAD